MRICLRVFPFDSMTLRLSGFAAEDQDKRLAGKKAT
jgi:hypothetical protein